MSVYGSPNGTPDPHGLKARQACMSCRKQKRKCNKALPACALCDRMNRHCDYSDTTPPPTSEDFHALRMRVMELESSLNGDNSTVNPQASFPTPSSTALSGSDSIGPPLPAYTPPQEHSWQGLQNRFPAIAFLDKDSFKYGGFALPKPSLEIPVVGYYFFLKAGILLFFNRMQLLPTGEPCRTSGADVLEFLGDGSSIQAVLSAYFATVHKWMPIVSQKRLTRNMVNPLWEAGPDLALLFLCMKLIISRPQDGIESSQNPVYMSAKRFLALMEVTGTVSLMVLQAGLLITWYEYGQAIYPSAWMSAGWCLRYGNLLGINGHADALQLLGRPATWTEQEERRRTWWGVLVADRIVSIGSQGHILTTQEPKQDDLLPVNDSAWDEGEMTHAIQRLVSSPVSDHVDPFPRLCQASVIMGKVLSHHYGEVFPSETAQFGLASQLYLEISILARKITAEATSSQDYVSLTAPLALTFSSLCVLCEAYSCPEAGEPSTVLSTEAAAMQMQAVDGLKTVANSIIDFAERIDAATPLPQDLDRVNPIIMDALYAAAASYAWMVRESGDESSQMALESLRHCLRRLGTRWRNAAEYLRILEAQEFTYAIGGGGS